jgi:hypothetical protein
MSEWSEPLSRRNLVQYQKMKENNISLTNLVPFIRLLGTHSDVALLFIGMEVFGNGNAKAMEWQGSNVNDAECGNELQKCGATNDGDGNVQGISNVYLKEAESWENVRNHHNLLGKCCNVLEHQEMIVRVSEMLGIAEIVMKCQVSQEIHSQQTKPNLCSDQRQPKVNWQF